MRTTSVALVIVAALAGTPAVAATVPDPAGDILPTFVGTATPDLDVTSFSVSLDAAATTFSLGAVLAGDINPANAGFYVIGVDTGRGAIAPFANIGEPNVVFDQTIVVQKDGTAKLGSNTLSVSIAGNQFIVTVPVSLLPSTGASTANYGFNIWPRAGSTVTNNFQITDFAPENSLLSANGVLAAVPEPGTWTMMLLGLGLIGGTVRFHGRRESRRRTPIAAV